MKNKKEAWIGPIQTTLFCTSLEQHKPLSLTELGRFKKLEQMVERISMFLPTHLPFFCPLPLILLLLLIFLFSSFYSPSSSYLLILFLLFSFFFFFSSFLPFLFIFLLYYRCHHPPTKPRWKLVSLLPLFFCL